MNKIYPTSRKEALQDKSQFYFTGKPCKHNHVTVRYSISGKCIDCQKIQSKEWNQSPKGVEYFEQWSQENPTYRHDYYKKKYKDQYIFMLLKGIKRRSKARGLEFSLIEEDIIIPEYCPVLNIRLEVGEGRPQDNSPSVDRIDSSKGYTPDNIIVVSLRANRLKSDATIDEMYKILSFYQKLIS